MKIAEPLLGEVGDDASVVNDDKKAVAEAITAEAVKTANYDSLEAAKEDGTAFVFMGHGTSHTAKVSYSQMQAQMQAQMQQQAAPAAPATPAAPAGWQCACGATATGKFCPECGAKKPEPKPAAERWQCACGATATGKFCPECGTPRPAPAADGWTCSCGAVNKGKFCPECGAKKPAGIPQYKCDKCGWEPDDPAHPPKFCPECGDPFDDGDLK